MEIVDEEPKKELPVLEPGDVIRAELDGQVYFYMIVDFMFQDNYRFALVSLDQSEKGMVTANGNEELETAEYDEFF